MTRKRIILYRYAPMGNATYVSAETLTRIRWESLTDPRTVSAAYEGKPVRPSSYARIVKAAEALGLPKPPTPTSGQQINPRSR